jgi:cytochrome P450
MSAGTELPSLLSPEVIECPHAHYARLREEAPVYRMPEIGFYVISRYAEVKQALQTPEVFASNVDISVFRRIAPDEEIRQIYLDGGWELLDILTSSDDPQHSKYRSFVNKSFTPGRVRSMVPYLRQIVHELIDSFIDRGRVELVTEYANPLPLYVMMDAIGAAREDLADLKRWTDYSVESFALTADREREIFLHTETLKMQHYLYQLIKARRESYHDDLLGDLVRGQDLGDGSERSERGGSERVELSDEELISLVREFLIAGNETTTNVTAAGVHLLCERPELQDELRGNDERIKGFVEEMLRVAAPLQGLFRQTLVDTTLDGVHIPAGSFVMLRVGSANRDAARFTDGDSFDLGRANNAQHLAFGAGKHTCVGSALGRTELFESFRILLDRCHNLRLDTESIGTEALTHKPNILMRGLIKLPVRFDKA